MIFLPSKNNKIELRIPPKVTVAKIFALYLISGGRTTILAIANANKTNNMEKPNKMDVIQRFPRSCFTSCLMNIFLAGRTLRAPEMTVVVAQKKDKLLKTQNMRKIGW